MDEPPTPEVTNRLHLLRETIAVAEKKQQLATLIELLTAWVALDPVENAVSISIGNQSTPHWSPAPGMEVFGLSMSPDSLKDFVSQEILRLVRSTTFWASSPKLNGTTAMPLRTEAILQSRMCTWRNS